MLHWLLAAALLAGAPTGQLTVKTPQLEATLSEQGAWTVRDLSYGGAPMILPQGGEGALVGAGGKWLGGSRDTETVTQLTVDAPKLEVGLKGDQIASGDTMKLHKESTILALKHSADITFAGDTIVQRHQFEATEDLTVGNFYAFAYSLSPKAKNWVAQPLSGQLLRGEFSADKSRKPDQPVRWLAQYDPATQKGVLMYFQQAMTGPDSLCNFWDTDTYHKMLAQPLTGKIAKGTKLDVTMVMRFFQSPADKWEATAQELAQGLQAQYPPAAAAVPAPARVYDVGVPEDGLLTLKTDHYTVPFSARQAWTIYEIAYDGKIVSHHNGYHGTVLIPKGGNFIGTGHTDGGREIVHSVTVKVDDAPEAPVGPAQMGQSLSGHRITLVKRSTIWKFDCTAEVTITDDQVLEHTVLQATEPTELTRLYYFMHCFQPTTTKWGAELPDGTFEQGDLVSDDKAKVQMKINKDTRWVSQYDPTSGLGLLCYTPKVIAGPGSASMVWDLSRYHKYYLQYTTRQSFQAGDKLDYAVIVKMVPGETGDFTASKAAAAQLEKDFAPVK